MLIVPGSLPLTRSAWRLLRHTLNLAASRYEMKVVKNPFSGFLDLVSDVFTLVLFRNNDCDRKDPEGGGIDSNFGGFCDRIIYAGEQATRQECEIKVRRECLKQRQRLRNACDGLRPPSQQQHARNICTASRFLSQLLRQSASI